MADFYFKGIKVLENMYVPPSCIIVSTSEKTYLITNYQPDINFENYTDEAIEHG